MPKEGFKSLTVTDKVYDNFFEIFQDHKESLRLIGINSFAGFLTFVLNKVFEDDQVWNNVFDQAINASSKSFKKLKR